MTKLKVALMMLVCAMPLTFLGCDANDGGAEKMGERMDNAADDAADGIEDAADDMKDGMEDACEKVSKEDC